MAYPKSDFRFESFGDVFKRKEGIPQLGENRGKIQNISDFQL